MAIGVRLKEERARLKLSQTDLGAAGGVGKTTQINYEKGVGSPDATYLAAVAEKGVDVLYVVTGERKPQLADSINADSAEFLEVYWRVNDTDRQLLLRMASAFATAAGLSGKKDTR
jgi:transcriptional regulator with XRE-family HTH domain